MSSQIVEYEIRGFITLLQEQGRDVEAMLLDMELFHAQGYLPRLVSIRDKWDKIINPEDQS